MFVFYAFFFFFCIIFIVLGGHSPQVTQYTQSGSLVRGVQNRAGVLSQHVSTTTRATECLAPPLTKQQSKGGLVYLPPF
jgi:hypothetical protein